MHRNIYEGGTIKFSFQLTFFTVEVNDDDRLEAESSEDGNIQLINEIEKERECMMVGMEQLEIFSGIEVN